MGGDRDRVNKRPREKLHDPCCISFYFSSPLIYLILFIKCSLSLCKLRYAEFSSLINVTEYLVLQIGPSTCLSIRTLVGLTESHEVVTGVASRRRNLCDATVLAWNYLLTPRSINYFRQDARRETAAAESSYLINTRTIFARQSVVRSCYHDVALFGRLCQLQQGAFTVVTTAASKICPVEIKGILSKDFLEEYANSPLRLFARQKQWVEVLIL